MAACKWHTILRDKGRLTGNRHNIVPQSLLEEEYWPYGYGCRESDTVCCLSVLYGIFCLGALWAPTPPPGALSPAQYSQLAILAMGQDPLSIIHIEGLILYACYLCGTDDTHGRAWACLGMAIKFAQTLGIGISIFFFSDLHILT